MRLHPTCLPLKKMKNNCLRYLKKYEKTEGRKSDTDSKNIVELLKNPNKFTFVIVGIAGVVLLLLVFVVRFLVKCYTKKRVKKIKKIEGKNVEEFNFKKSRAGRQK